MKNINKIIISLSLLAMVPVVAQNGLEKPSVSGVLKDAGKAVIQAKDAVIHGTSTVVKGTGKALDSGIMSFPYYAGSAVGYVASGIKNTVFYGVKVPFRLVGWGLDGTFGDGMSNAVYNKTKTGLGLGLTAVLLGSAYKGLNSFAKLIAISDIQEIFKNGGEVDELQHATERKYKIEHQSLHTFYNALAETVKDRFERTDVMSYVQKYGKDYVEVTLVCNKIEELIQSALENNDAKHDVASICAIARRKSTNGLFGRFNPLNGYCHDALILYGKLILAAKIAEKNSTLLHADILKKIEMNVSQKLLQN